MKHIIRTFMVSLGLMAGFAVAAAPSAHAIKVFDACTGNSATEVCKAKKDSVSGPVKVLINTMLFAIGFVSVIMIIIGGFKYVVSNGDSSQITSAKNTILYAVIGLVVALLAYAIVNFVVAQFA